MPGGAMVTALDSQSRARGFNSRPFNDLGQVVHRHVPLITKQYKLIPAKGRWWCISGRQCETKDTEADGQCIAFCACLFHSFYWYSLHIGMARLSWPGFTEIFCPHTDSYPSSTNRAQCSATVLCRDQHVTTTPNTHAFIVVMAARGWSEIDKN